MRVQPHWLKKVVLLPVAVGLLVSSLVLLILLLGVMSYSARQEFDRGLISIRAHWSHALERHGLKLHALSETVLQVAPLREALLAGNGEALGEAAAPLFAHLQRDHRITSLSLFAPDGRALLGLEQGALGGAPFKLPVLRQAMASGTPQGGVALDRWSAPHLLAATPWRHGGRLLGYLVLGEPVEPLVRELDDVLRMQHFIAIPSQHLGSRPLTVLPLSAATPPKVLARWLEQGRIQELEEGVALERAERWLFAGAIPLEDVAGTRLGWLITLRDVTDVRATLLVGAGLITLVSLATFTLLLLLFRRACRDADRQLAAAAGRAGAPRCRPGDAEGGP